MTINERFKQVRKKQGLSQDGFGKALGITAAAVSKIETSHRNVTKQMVKSLCSVFDVNEPWLLNGEGDMHIAGMKEKRDVQEATELFASLTPKLQEYALKQIRGLLEVQNEQFATKNDDQ